jgi:acyl-CoA synthetase (AMP-forming)/AMP-acid ligase II
MLRTSVEQQGAAEAVVETGGGPRLSYTQLWDRAARVTGGLRALGVERGDRVAIRLGNGLGLLEQAIGDSAGLRRRLAAHRRYGQDQRRRPGLPVDRIKDMINRGGENVYCVEVENALAGAPGVYEAAVLGVPDEMMGEKVGAVIVPMPGVSLDVPAVFGYLTAHIADFKVPQYVAVSAAPLPRNPGGKLLKRRLREDVDWAAAVRR